MNTRRLLRYRMTYLLTRPAFLVLLALIPLCLLVSSSLQDESAQEGIQAGYYCEDSTIASALDHAPSLFSFVRYATEDELRLAAAEGKVECAYIISKNLLRDMENENADKDILVISTATSRLIPIVNETLFSLLFEAAAPRLLAGYLTQDDTLTINDAQQWIDERYTAYLAGGYTYAFSYENAPAEYKSARQSIWRSPLRGLMAILMLFAGFTGLLSSCRLNHLSHLSSHGVRLVYCLAPMILTLLPIMLILCLAPSPAAGPGGVWGIIKELVKLLLYQLLCLVFLMLLGTLIKKSAVLYAIMPVYLICCFIFCPVFIDAAAFIPALKPLRYIFLPSYYLLMPL